jgi:hypothetical protein
MWTIALSINYDVETKAIKKLGNFTKDIMSVLDNVFISLHIKLLSIALKYFFFQWFLICNNVSFLLSVHRHFFNREISLSPWLGCVTVLWLWRSHMCHFALLEHYASCFSWPCLKVISSVGLITAIPSYLNLNTHFMIWMIQVMTLLVSFCLLLWYLYFNVRHIVFKWHIMYVNTAYLVTKMELVHLPLLQLV